MSDNEMDYDPRTCRNDTSEALIACQRGRCECKDEDMAKLRAQVAELESERDKWKRRAYAASDEIEGLEAENGRLRSIADDLEQRFTSGNDGPVREG